MLGGVIGTYLARQEKDQAPHIVDVACTSEWNGGLHSSVSD